MTTNPLTGYAALAAVIDSPDNRHRRDGKATVVIGYQGGRTRYLWLVRDKYGPIIRATLFGHTVAAVDPHGTIVLDPCGYFTECTRDAFGCLVALMEGHAPVNNCRAMLHTPGSKGGEGGPWSLTVYVGGRSFVMSEGDGPLTIPAEVFA